MEQNTQLAPCDSKSEGFEGDIGQHRPRGPWELLFGVICLMLPRGPGCRSVLGIPWKPPKSTQEEAKNGENNTKLVTIHHSPSKRRGPHNRARSP